MSAVHRMKDLADIIELVQSLELGAEFAAELHEDVREKYREMWAAAQAARHDTM